VYGRRPSITVIVGEKVPGQQRDDTDRGNLLCQFEVGDGRRVACSCWSLRLPGALCVRRVSVAALSISIERSSNATNGRCAWNSRERRQPGFDHEWDIPPILYGKRPPLLNDARKRQLSR
jgi:hypothetical protein